MKIELKKITVRDVAKNYIDNEEEGVIGYDGKLNIRPAYQREFIYNDKQRNEVINSVRHEFPLNVMYWAKNEDGTFELLDGQQRTISLCQYVTGAFSINYQYIHTLTKTEQEQILNYELMIYICEGTDKEKLEWFKIINIAGEKLTPQELRNAIYTGEWLSDAKRYFSKTSCNAYKIAKDYISGTPIRQDYLEKAIYWIASKDNSPIEDYMSKHQHDKNANELWLYFQNVINWVKVLFPTYRKEMKGIDWGLLYNEYHDKSYDADELEKKIVSLIDNDEVQSVKGIYEYLFDGKEKHLNLRAFSDKIKRKKYEEQDGICPICKNHFDISEMDADHIIPWHKGGKTEESNCQMLCRKCNQEKSGK